MTDLDKKMVESITRKAMRCARLDTINWMLELASGLPLEQHQAMARLIGGRIEELLARSV